jgi:hypothetical protein
VTFNIVCRGHYWVLMVRLDSGENIVKSGSYKECIAELERIKQKIKA